MVIFKPVAIKKPASLWEHGKNNSKHKAGLYYYQKMILACAKLKNIPHGKNVTGGIKILSILNQWKNFLRC